MAAVPQITMVGAVVAASVISSGSAPVTSQDRPSVATKRATLAATAKPSGDPLVMPTSPDGPVVSTAYVEPASKPVDRSQSVAATLERLARDRGGVAKSTPKLFAP